MWWKYKTLFRSFIQSLLHPALWQPSPTKQFVRILCISLSFSTLALLFLCLSLNKDNRWPVNYVWGWMDFSAAQTLLSDFSWGSSQLFIIPRDETYWQNSHLEQHSNTNHRISQPVETWVSIFKRRHIKTYYYTMLMSSFNGMDISYWDCVILWTIVWKHFDCRLSWLYLVLWYIVFNM